MVTLWSRYGHVTNSHTTRTVTCGAREQKKEQKKTRCGHATARYRATLSGDGTLPAERGPLWGSGAWIWGGGPTLAACGSHCVRSSIPRVSVHCVRSSIPRVSVHSTVSVPAYAHSVVGQQRSSIP
eukprot:3588169-Rhodomonas_salina.1